MKRFILKALLSVVAFMFVGQVHAQYSVSGDAIEVTPGENYTLEVYLTNEGLVDDIYSVQFYLTLPEGIEAGEDAVFLRFTPSTSNCKKASGKDYYTVMASDISKSSTVEGTSGIIVKIPLTISSSIDLSSPLTATFTNMKVSTVSKAKPTWQGGEYSFTIKQKEAATTETIILGNEWNTYCSTNNLDFTGTGVGAYLVSSITKTSVVLSSVTNVRADVGFVIKGSKYESKTITPAIVSTASEAESLLVGVTVDTTLPAGHYVLKGDAFVPSTAGGILPAHKAYLPKDVVDAALASGAKFFTFDFGESTGINEVQATQADGAIYNLNGMRVGNMQKGVYIMNGRKVIVK